MALPLRLLWGLQISRRQKIALAAIFSLGFIIIIFAIVRVTQTSASSHHVDPVWLALWSVIEASVGMSNIKLLPWFIRSGLIHPNQRSLCPAYPPFVSLLAPVQCHSTKVTQPLPRVLATPETTKVPLV